MFDSMKNWTETQREAFKAALPVTMPQAIGLFRDDTWTTQEGVDVVIDGWKASTRRIFAEAGHLNHAGFIFCSKDPRSLEPSNVIMATEAKGGTYGETAKEALIHVVRITAERGEAVAILMVCEAWMCVCKDMAEVNAWRDAHGGTVEGHPDTKEMVMMTVETARGTQMHMAEITHDSEGRRHMGAWETQPMTGVTGRFTGLLRKVDWSVS